MAPEVNCQLGRVLGTVRTDLASGGNENRFETCFKDCVGMEGEIITKIGVEMGMNWKTGSLDRNSMTE